MFHNVKHGRTSTYINYYNVFCYCFNENFKDYKITLFTQYTFDMYSNES